MMKSFKLREYYCVSDFQPRPWNAENEGLVEVNDIEPPSVLMAICHGGMQFTSNPFITTSPAMHHNSTRNMVDESIQSEKDLTTNNQHVQTPYGPSRNTPSATAQVVFVNKVYLYS